MHQPLGSLLLPLCFSIYSQHSSQDVPIKVSFRSHHSSGQNPPVASHLTQKKNQLPWPLRPHWSHFTGSFIYLEPTNVTLQGLCTCFSCLEFSLPCLLQVLSITVLGWHQPLYLKLQHSLLGTWLPIPCFVFFPWGNDFCLFYPLWWPQCLGQCLALRMLNEWDW